MDGNENCIGSVGVCPADSFFEGDIGFFRNKPDGVKSSLSKAADYCSGNFSCVTVLEESAVRRTFSGSFDSMTVVNQNLHRRFRF